MKQFFTILIVATAVFMAGCKDDPKPTPNGKINFTSAEGLYYGDHYETGTGLYIVNLKSTAGDLQLALFSGMENIAIGAGEYTTGTTTEGKELTFIPGSTSEYSTKYVSGGTTHMVNGGSFTVSGNYTISVNLTTSEGTRIEGTYSGNINITNGIEGPEGYTRLANFDGRFDGNLMGYGSSHLRLLLYNGEYVKEQENTEGEFQGAFESIQILCFNELAYFSEFEMETGEYTFESYSNGDPGTFYAIDPNDPERWQPFYRKFEGDGTRTDVLIDGGRFTITEITGGYRVLMDLTGFYPDSEDPDNDNIELKFYYDGPLDFWTSVNDYNVYDTWTEFIYYDGMVFDGVGDFRVNLSSSERGDADRVYIQLIGERIENPTHFNLKLTPGTYPLSSEPTVGTAYIGKQEGGGVMGTYYLDLTNTSSPAVYFATEGSVEVSLTDDGYHIELNCTKYVHWGTGETAYLPRTFYFDGSPIYGTYVPTDPIVIDNSNTQLVNGQIRYNKSAYDDEEGPKLDYAFVNIWNADSTENIRINPYMNRIADDVPAYIPDGIYTCTKGSGVPGPGQFSQGKNEGGYGIQGANYTKITDHTSKYYVRNVFFFDTDSYWYPDWNETNTVKITRNEGNNYTFEFDFVGKDARTSLKTTYFKYEFTGDFRIIDERK